MTDPKARDNFSKYGSPDGFGAGNFQISVALPKILQEKDFQIQVLVIAFILIILIIPYYFYRYFN